MIDIDKIEKDARYDKYLDTVHVLHPTTVLEMVALIRKQREVMQQALEALNRTEAYLRIEVNEAYARDAHISTIDKWKEMLVHHKGTIKALEEVLK